MSLRARIAIVLVLLAAAALLLGQGMIGRGVAPAERAEFSGRPWPAKLVDIASHAGLTTPLIYGGVQRTEYLFETSSGGVAALDYDNDGWVDLFFVAGTRLGSAPASAGNRLYRNHRNGTFADVTATAGLGRVAWGSGAAAADYDNDGDTDLYVTEYGRNTLYRNQGNGTFRDVTEPAGLPGQGRARWGAGATFIDYDRDGRLDLFTSEYVDFDVARVAKPGANPFCTWMGIDVPCGPRGLEPGRNRLYRNRGDGTFEDVSRVSGIAAATGSYCMTAVTLDVDGDGWADILVACDSTPSYLFRNRGDGTFREEGIQRGFALADDGREQAGMGIAAGDFNLDGRVDLVKTHYADDTQGLYRNEGRGQFRDVTLPGGLGVETRVVAWGAGFPDLDNDGLPDIFLVTGGVYPDTEGRLRDYPYRDRRLLFRNLGEGRFEQIRGIGGPGLDARHSSRGCAFVDFDNDGDLDVAIFNRNEAPSLLRNDLAAKHRWLELQLRGTQSNRSAVGAHVVVHYGGRKQAGAVTSQASFYSANDPRLHFGLGQAAGPVDVEVRWPSGVTERFNGVASNQVAVLREGSGSRSVRSAGGAHAK